MNIFQNLMTSAERYSNALALRAQEVEQKTFTRYQEQVAIFEQKAIRRQEIIDLAAAGTISSSTALDELKATLKNMETFDRINARPTGNNDDQQ